MAIGSIINDPRYEQFFERYHGDPLHFAVEVTGFCPSYDQIELFKAIAPPNAKVSVVSGTSTGKTAAFARIALWHFLCCPFAQYDGKTELGSNTYIGAPVIQTVADGIWKEMEDCRAAIANSASSWLNDYYEITKTQVNMLAHPLQWFIKQIAMKKGKHRYWQLIIIDEAAGVPDEHFNVIDGTQTQPGNRTLLASQGVRNTGRFYDTHHSLAITNGGSWLPLVFNSENSPFASKEWLLDRKYECGGRNTEEYRIRVLGEFVENTSSVLLTRTDIEKAFQKDSIIKPNEPFGYLVLCDVALGEYRDESVVIVAKVIGNEDSGQDARRVEFVAIPVCSNSINTIDLTGRLVEIMGQYSNPVLLVDAGGVGGPVCQNLERQSVNVTKIQWGQPCWSNARKKRFYNQRAYCMVAFRNAVRDNRVRIPTNLPQRIKNKIIDQAIRIPYHFTDAGTARYQIEGKEQMRKDGIKSPDLIDAMSFAFHERAQYFLAEDSIAQQTQSLESLTAQVTDRFADI